LVSGVPPWDPPPIDARGRETDALVGLPGSRTA